MSQISPRVAANLTVVVILSLLVVAGAGFRFLGTFGTEQRELAVELPDSGGVRAAQPVTVRGVGIGNVLGTELAGDGVRVRLGVDPEADVPRHAFVQVLRRSPIGEQAVELIPVPADWEPPDGGADDAFVARDLPRAEGWPTLGEGEEIDVRGTSVPASVPRVLSLAEELLSTVDVESLVTLVDELGTAFEGRDQTLRELTRDGVELSETLLDASGEIERLLEVSGPTLRTIHEQRDALRAGLDNSADLLETFAARDDELTALLGAAPGALDETTRFVDQQAANLSCLNRDLLSLTRTLAADDVRPFIGQLLDMQRFFYGSFDAGTQWDPYRPQQLWARVNILLFEGSNHPPPESKEPRTPTPATLPGAHCDSPFGLGVDAVRQADPEPPDPTSPGIDYAPRQEGARDRGDHDQLDEARDRRRPPQ